MTKPKRKISKKKNIGLFLILILLILALLNSINHYVIWDVFETTQSAIDRFSIGHIIFGLLICIISILLLEKFSKIKGFHIIIIALTLTFIVGIAWEIFENSPMIVNTLIKFNNIKDSPVNSAMDMLFNMLGASLVCIIFWHLIIKKKL